MAIEWNVQTWALHSPKRSSRSIVYMWSSLCFWLCTGQSCTFSPVTATCQRSQKEHDGNVANSEKRATGR